MFSFFFRPLPWEYGVRNLMRRPGRSAMTTVGLTIVCLLVVLVVSFLRGLERTLAVSGDADTVLVHLVGASENLENSSVPARTATLVSASLAAVRKSANGAYVSPELFMGARLTLEGNIQKSMGLIRGVTTSVPLVRQKFQLLSGHWPQQNEILVGRLASAKLGAVRDQLAVGKPIQLEGKTWKVSGTFAVGGSAMESELWCRLEDFQLALKRDDLCMVALKLAPGSDFGDVDEFCKDRLDLSLESTPEQTYYQTLQRNYGPIRSVAWIIVGLVSAAGVFAGLNTMFASVAGRVREIACLQTMGFGRRAIGLSLIQEGVILAATASLIAALVGVLLLDGAAVRFTMGAFSLRVDPTTLWIGCAVGMFIGIAGSVPPAIRAMRLPIVEGLKSL